MPGGWRWWEYLEWWCVAAHHRLWEGRAPLKVGFPLATWLGGCFFFCGSVWNGGSRYSKKSLRKDSDSLDFWREYLQWSCCTVPKCRNYIQFHIDPIFQRNKSMHWTKLGRDIFRMMNCWSSIQPARFFFRVCCFWKKPAGHVETIFWWSGTLLELFSENNKRGRKLGLSGKMAFFFCDFRGRNFGKLSSAKKRHFSGEKVRVLTTPKTLFESCMAWRVWKGILLLGNLPVP